VLSNPRESYERYLKRLIREDALKETDLPYLQNYLQDKV